MRSRVLFIEDEATLAMIVRDMLLREGFDVIMASNGAEGLAEYHKHRPDAIISDVMMPKVDGFEMIKRLRKIDRDVPVLFLTARSAIDDIVEGFELGANDYLKKPFSMEELLVRLKALLRRNQKNNEVIAIGRYTFNPSTQRLAIGGEVYELSHIESLILRELAEHINEPVETRTLMLLVWQNDDPYNLNRLHGFIFKLRKYLADDRNLSILNMRGVGYKLTMKD